MDAVRRLPNLLSLLRLAAVPGLLGLGWLGLEAGFLVLLGCSLASDVADGWLARRLRAASTLGARLDSWADLATYSAVPVAVLWLWPGVVREERVPIAIALVAYALPIAWGWIRFRRLTSYHTRGAKLAAVAMGLGLLALLGLGVATPFRVACALLVVEAIEEIAITCVLPRWTADVPSLAHAIAIARAERVRRSDRA